MEMKEILNRFSDCDTFSLSLGISRHNKKNGILPIPEYNISREEYKNAVEKLRKHIESKPYNCNTDMEMGLINELAMRESLFLPNGKNARCIVRLFVIMWQLQINMNLEKKQ